MTEITLTDVAATQESTAVAAGKMVLAALPPDGALRIADNDLPEDVWAEMCAYLSRRGVTVSYDHDDGFPVARRV